MNVAQHMTRNLYTCTPTTSLDEAVGRMDRHDCGSLPVVPAEGRHELLGMITDRDACIAAYRHGKGLEDLEVRDAMTTEVVACAPDDDLHTAAARMQEARVRRLPVVDPGGQLRGYLTLASLARAASRGRAGAFASRDVGRLLASICEPTPAARSGGPA